MPVTTHARLHGDRARRGVVVAAIVAVWASAAVASLAMAQSAAANPAGAHDPIGSVKSVKAVTGGLKMTGWAADPDALTSNAAIVGLVDGRSVAATGVTTVAYASVTTKYKTGPTPGFTLTIPVPSGNHTVCLIGRNSGRGLDTLLKCVPTPIGTTLSSAQIAARSPSGAISHASVSASSIRVRGWASDPDYVSRRSTVVLYVDGFSAATRTTTSYPQPRPAKAGYRSAFNITVPVSVGAHLGCIWAVNIGLGSNKFLGCRAVDTRGAAGTGTVATPAANTTVVTIAKRQIGKPYVWGASGPKTFDCSGLVLYSYAKAHVTTTHQSEAQFAAARLIPASRAVPGDLVFTHDSQGDVYHVGIYTGPGMSVAAIDPQQGVDWQAIWSPVMTTYGSLTHI
jgi:cell wall-associated NlpC family hydrolase